MNKKEREMIAQDKEQHRDGLGRAVVGSLLIMAMGALLLFRPLYSFETMVLVLGWVLTVGGAVGIVMALLSWGVSGVDELLGSIAALVCGIVFLVFPWLVTYILGVVMCLQIIFQAFGTLAQGLALRKTGLSVLPNLLLTLCLMVLGALILCWPLITARWLLQVLGATMIIGAIANLVIRAVGARRLHRVQKAVIDAEN